MHTLSSPRSLCLASHFLFDLDGTLVDSSADLTASVGFALTSLGLPALPVTRVMLHVGDGVTALVQRCLNEVSGAADPVAEARAVAAFQSHYAKHATVHTRPYPGMRAILAAAGATRVALVSNKPEAFCRQILRDLDLDAFFSVVIGGDTTPEKKPHAEPVLTALHRLGATAKTSVMIGDGPADLAAGRAAGVPVVGVAWGYTRYSELLEMKPDRIVLSAPELASALGLPSPRS